MLRCSAPRGSSLCAGQQLDPMLLQENMVANLEPYFGKPGTGGVRLEHDLVIRANGPEIYTTYPFDKRLLRDVHPLDSTTGRVITGP